MRIANSTNAPALRPHPKGWLRQVALLLALLLAACSVEPQPIHFGSEECAQCRMVVSDPQWAAQALNTRGRAFNFDSIECLAAFLNEGVQVAREDLHSAWVMDFGEPEEWIRVEDAAFLRSDALRSPMGAGLSAHASAESARQHQAQLGGEVLGWNEVLALVEREGLHADHAHGH